MTRELRRFDASATCGTRYTVVERGMFATVDGREVQIGVSSFTTATGWLVSPTTSSGEYRIERLRLTVRG